MKKEALRNLLNEKATLERLVEELQIGRNAEQRDASQSRLYQAAPDLMGRVLLRIATVNQRIEELSQLLTAAQPTSAE